MMIKKMTASFGRLDRAQLELSDGLNILHAPNEGGKSTWCAFIRAMFYGVPTRDRDKKGYLAEKNRYQPWSGAPMEGEMTLEWQGRDITLRRFPAGNVPFGGFSAVYADTQQPVPGLSAQNCGETLLGVGREVWERSAFIGSAPTLAIDGTPELERRIASLFSSGQEDVSFSQTEAKLREWLRRRKHNKTGLIPQLEQELAEIDLTLERMQSAQSRLAQVQEQRPQLHSQLQELEGEAHIHRRLSQRDLNGRYAQALQEHSQVRAQLDALQAQQAQFGPLPHRDRLRDAQLQLQRLELQQEDLLLQSKQIPSDAPDAPEDARFAGLDGAQAVRRAQDERTRAEALFAQIREKEQKRRSLVLTALGYFIGCAIAGLATGYFLVGLAVGAILSAMMATAMLTRNKDAISRLQVQAQEILARWNVTGPQQITNAAELYRQQTEEFTRRQEALSRRQAELADRRDALTRAGADLLTFVRTFSPNTNSLSGCAAALGDALELEDRLRECRSRLELTARRCEDLKSQGAQQADTLEALHAPQRTPAQTDLLLAQVKTDLAALDQQEAMAQGELLTLGDRAQLEAKKESLCAQLDRRRTEYQALEQALTALTQANAQLQQRFAPRLNQQAGGLLAALTDGRYTDLSLDREMQASARSTDSLLPHSSLSLSRGTADQVYLAVRLAVCQLCLPEQDPSPLVLDDALLTFDDERMALALNVLTGLERQVLLFSCQQRESRLGIGRILSLQS